MELLAARLQEHGPVFDRDLLERLEAIGGEARADHVRASHAFLAELAQRGVGGRLQPFRGAEARLERDHRARAVPAELGGDQPRALAPWLLVLVTRSPHGPRHTR